MNEKANEIRKAKRNLELLKQDGCGTLIFDAMNLCAKYVSGCDITEEDGSKYLLDLKRGYEQFIRDNGDGKGELKQGRLEL